MAKFRFNFLLFLLPLIVLFLFITSLDVFKIFRTYDDYYKNNFVTLNREFICAETYNKYRDSINFNSFIFGSSRSQAFKVKEWKKYLDDGAEPFHFDASGEGIYGISSKINYINETGGAINNAIIVLDNATLKQTSPRDGHLFIPPNYISKKSNYQFYVTFLKAQMNPNFIVAYFDYLIFKTYRSYMGRIIEKSKYKPITNSINCDIWYGYDEYIKQDSLRYYNRLTKKGVFYDRGEIKNNKSEISLLEIRILNNIKNIFELHKTNYKIIISPVYDQVPLSKDRIQLLNQIFGSKNIHNYSGINRFTKPIHNYYETSHYRPHVANEILSLIYSNKKINKMNNSSLN